MHRRPIAAVLIAVATLVLVTGCVPKRAGPQPWVNPLDVAEAGLVKDPKDRNYGLCRMEFGREAIMLGCPMRAQPRLKEAFDQLEVEHDNVGAAISSEKLKYYKGETYERAMLCIYLGMIEYQAGNYNNARIFFSRALSADRAAVIRKETPPEVGDDFGLAYYWIGKTYARLNDMDNCAIAFRKTGAPTPRKAGDLKREQSQDSHLATDFQKKEAEGEKWTYERFHSAKEPKLFIDGIVNLADVRGALATAPAKLEGAPPESPVLRATDKREEFLTPAFQAETNLVLMIEVGPCPLKMLTGINQERVEFLRWPTRPHHVRVYFDGHAAGPAFPVLDLWDQAATQDRVFEKEAAQTTKGIAKYILQQMPYAGSVADYWDVSGDDRLWRSLPGKVFVFAGKIAPGPHTVRLEMYDANGNLIPRWTNTYYGVGAPKAGEACVLLDPHVDADNRLPPDLVEKAIENGTRPPAMLEMPLVAGYSYW